MVRTLTGTSPTAPSAAAPASVPASSPAKSASLIASMPEQRVRDGQQCVACAARAPRGAKHVISKSALILMACGERRRVICDMRASFKSARQQDTDQIPARDEGQSVARAGLRSSISIPAKTVSKSLHIGHSVSRSTLRKLQCI